MQLNLLAPKVKRALARFTAFLNKASDKFSQVKGGALAELKKNFISIADTLLEQKNETFWEIIGAEAGNPFKFIAAHFRQSTVAPDEQAKVVASLQGRQLKTALGRPSDSEFQHIVDADVLKQADKETSALANLVER